MNFFSLFLNLLNLLLIFLIQFLVYLVTFWLLSIDVVLAILKLLLVFLLFLFKEFFLFFFYFSLQFSDFSLTVFPKSICFHFDDLILINFFNLRMLDSKYLSLNIFKFFLILNFKLTMNLSPNKIFSNISNKNIKITHI